MLFPSDGETSSSELLMEEEKLQSRLEQQSNLICMLKQRSDKTLKELSDVTSKYESSHEHLESLQQSLAEESRHRKLLEQRFFILAKNHEDMISLKDEYKGEAYKLRQKLLSGQREHEDGLRKSVEQEEEVDRIEQQWQERLTGMERRVTLVEEQRDTAQKRASQLEGSMQSSVGEHSEIEQRLKASLTAAEGENMAVWEECKAKDKQVKQLESRLSEVQQDCCNLTTQLQHVVERVRLLEQELAVTKVREGERADRLSRDSTILALKKELQTNRESLVSVKKEYEAYKKHCSELLAHERKLNQQLRHLLE